MKAAHPFSVLLIDDSPEEVRLMIEGLSKEYNVFFALDGAEGIQVARREKPDLILLDIYMEAMDGYDVCRRLKSDPETDTIPLVFITGSLAEADHVHGLELGAVDFINKPISTTVLKQRVAQHLRLKCSIDNYIKENRVRKQAEDALQKKVRELETFINNLPHKAWLKDAQSRFIIVNQALADAAKTDSENFRGHIAKDFFPEEFSQLLDDGDARVIEEKKPIIHEKYMVDKEDHQIFFEVRKAPIFGDMQDVVGTVGIAIDVTGQKQLHLQLQETQKMKALGTLAGGIAHDFNNLLMGIQGRVSLMAAEAELAPSLRDHLTAIEEYVHSAANLTNQLLGMARGGRYEVNPVDLNEIAINCASMFGRTRKDIKIHSKMMTPALVIEADKRQIEQVLLNLFVNAWQAMPGGGQIFLETMMVDLDEVFCLPYQVAPGTYAKISIADTGIGMDEVVRQQIFDPFFTTKEKSRGTGLGLSSAYTIIKNHRGMITVESKVEQGSTFCIYLPASDKSVQRTDHREMDMSKGSGTVLLVDDEELIIKVGGAMLEKLGYQVFAASGCKQAIDMISNSGDEIDLVILDMVMPDMDGEATFDRIREIQPEVPVLLSSGYAIDDRTRAILQRGCNGFIQKPFNLSALSQKIRHVLDEVGSPKKNASA